MLRLFRLALFVHQGMFFIEDESEMFEDLFRVFTFSIEHSRQRHDLTSSVNQMILGERSLITLSNNALPYVAWWTSYLLMGLIH